MDYLSTFSKELYFKSIFIVQLQNQVVKKMTDLQTWANIANIMSLIVAVIAIVISLYVKKKVSEIKIEVLRRTKYNGMMD